MQERWRVDFWQINWKLFMASSWRRKLSDGNRDWCLCALFFDFRMSLNALVRRVSTYRVSVFHIVRFHVDQNRKCCCSNTKQAIHGNVLCINIFDWQFIYSFLYCSNLPICKNGVYRDVKFKVVWHFFIEICVKESIRLDWKSSRVKEFRFVVIFSWNVQSVMRPVSNCVSTVECRWYTFDHWWLCCSSVVSFLSFNFIFFLNFLLPAREPQSERM